jgi:hypothetical protein
MGIHQEWKDKTQRAKDSQDLRKKDRKALKTDLKNHWSNGTFRVGYSKKYSDGWDRIFGTETRNGIQKQGDAAAEKASEDLD